MLEAALELKEVFSCLDTADPDYQPTLSLDDWKQIETLCTYLRLLYDAANVVSSTRRPTADHFFHEVWKIQLELVCGAVSQDPLIFNITNLLREKFDTYWKDCSLILAVAVVLDPQFKMKLVECSFSKIYGDEASSYVKLVEEAIHELFSEYVVQFLPLTYVDQGSIGIVKIEEPFDVPDGTLPADDFFDSEAFMSELSNSHNAKSELDQYLEEPVLPFSLNFDVLSWWDINDFKYPTLSKMARDILCIPMSTVAPEYVFCTGNRELDSYWSSLQPETLQALKCAKNWLQHGLAETSNALSKIEVSV